MEISEYHTNHMAIAWLLYFEWIDELNEWIVELNEWICELKEWIDEGEPFIIIC